MGPAAGGGRHTVPHPHPHWVRARGGESQARGSTSTNSRQEAPGPSQKMQCSRSCLGRAHRADRAERGQGGFLEGLLAEQAFSGWRKRGREQRRQRLQQQRHEDQSREGWQRPRQGPGEPKPARGLAAGTLRSEGSCPVCHGRSQSWLGRALPSLRPPSAQPEPAAALGSRWQAATHRCGAGCSP